MVTCYVFCRGAALANGIVASAAKVCADVAAAAPSVEAAAMGWLRSVGSIKF